MSPIHLPHVNNHATFSYTAYGNINWNHLYGRQLGIIYLIRMHMLLFLGKDNQLNVYLIFPTTQTLLKVLERD